MDDKEREIFSNEDGSGNEESQSNTDEINERQTALMIACKTGNVAAVREILEWRDEDGQRVDISARDENGQTALSLAKQSNNAEIEAMIQQNLFLRAVENGDTDTVKAYLTAKESNFEDLHDLEHYMPADNHEHSYEQMEIRSREKCPRKRSEEEIEALQFTFNLSITRSVWLEAVAIAQDKCLYKMLNLLFNDDRFIHGFNDDGQTILHQVVAEYLEVGFFSEKMKTKLKTIEILLKYANVLNLEKGTIFEIVCKIKPKHKSQIDDHLRADIQNGIKIRPKHCSQIDDLLRILLQNGIDLNGRNENGETFLMLACKNERIDLVRSLIKMASRELVLDIDAVDNSGETALMKAKRNNDSKIVAALLILKLIYAVEDKKEDIIKFLLKEFRNTSCIFVKSLSTNQDDDDTRRKKEYKFNIWREAMYIAMEKDSKHSEEILKLLLDCDILLIQEIETGYSSFEQIMGGWKVDDKQKLHLFELLLKCGKINANDRDENGRTPLHLAEKENLISLLIRYGADINRKDNEGRTPLMHFSRLWSKENLPVFWTLLEEAGTLVNLDAMDYNGQTALMHAVMFYRSDAVDLLLKKGASANLSDHRGFTALHHIIRGNINELFEFSRNSKELKKIKKVFNLFNVIKEQKNLIFEGEKWSEDSMKIVESLLQRLDIDVNALSFEKFSPLDLVEGKIPEIPSSIKDALKEKGAVLNVFRQTDSQSTSDFHLDFTYKLILENLAYQILENRDDILGTLKSRWRILIEPFKDQLVSDKDPQGRTALHLTAIFSFCLLNKSCKTRFGFSDTLVDKLISLGCSVNERDIFGRTPLHYTKDVLWELLTSRGADASIKDNDGNIAIDPTSRESSDKTSDIVKAVIVRNDETCYLRLLNQKQMEIEFQCVDSEVRASGYRTVPINLWEMGKFAFRHPLVKEITKEVEDLMNDIAKEIERLDPRFAVRVELVGSSNEGTRLGKPDEYDFCFVLTEISELCEVSQSPELPSGFVRLKRKPTKVGGTKGSDFYSFFGKDEILNTEKLKWQFATILSYAVTNINSQLNLEWILELTFKHHSIYNKIKKVFNISMTKPLNSTSVDYISIDIVPCIHVDGWWPDEAISNVSDEIKTFGCNLVFNRPQELYPWVPYSESCARISFSKAESDAIKQSCDNAREAYMIGKMILQNSIYVSQYILKNSLLYCIKALTPTSEKASQLGLSLEEMKLKFHQMDRYLWLKCLMKCHLEFVAQDFCPCYFLPTFSNFSLIGKDKNSKTLQYLKNVSLYWIADRPSTPLKNDSSYPLLCKEACGLYRCTSNDISESSYQLPAPDPLWERFDRKQLISSLCEIAYK